MGDLLGLNLQPHEFGYVQIILRALVVFVAALVIVRVGAAKRFLGRKTVFDFILAFVLGSMLSRAINGSGPLFQTLVGAVALVLFHRLLAWLSFRFHRLGRLVKGAEDVVITDGQVQREAMRRNCFTEKDLMEDLRLKSHDSPSDIKSARIERSGELSVVPFDKSAKAQPSKTDKMS